MNTEFYAIDGFIIIVLTLVCFFMFLKINSLKRQNKILKKELNNLKSKVEKI